MSKAWRRAGWVVGFLVCGTATADNEGIIRIVGQTTSVPVSDAVVYINGKGKAVDANGEVRVTLGEVPVELTIAYRDGATRHIETIHGFPPREVTTVHVPHKSSIKREAVFSLGVPFGPIQREAKALVILPQLAYESGGLNFGHYNNVRLYSDQIQDDGRMTLMVVALDEKLIPAKYGYMLDVDPSALEAGHIMFKPPLATDIDKEVQLVRWQKEADPINPSDSKTACDFNAPPYTGCGLYPDKGGVFSWINVWRKGELFHAPGAFLPPRTAGANPLMVLPDAQIELVAHDDPKGFAPFNYARHRFLRFDASPADVVSLTMPNVVIGSLEQHGADAIQVNAASREARFTINSVGESRSDEQNLDFGQLQIIWTDSEESVRTIWNQYFEPKAGENIVAPTAVARSLSSWLPDAKQDQFENVQVWLYGSDGVNGYGEAIELYADGRETVRQGDGAFQVTRWR